MSRKALANLSVVFDRLGWKVGNTRINQLRGTLSILYHREEFLYAFRSTVPRRQIHDSLVINPQNLIGWTLALNIPAWKSLQLSTKTQAAQLAQMSSKRSATTVPTVAPKKSSSTTPKNSNISNKPCKLCAQDTVLAAPSVKRKGDPLPSTTEKDTHDGRKIGENKLLSKTSKTTRYDALVIGLAMGSG